MIIIALSFFLFLNFITLASEPVEIEWVSGSVGGGWYSMAAGIAELIKEFAPEITIKVLPGGGMANPIRVGSGEVMLGWGVNPFDYMSFNGIAEYKDSSPNLRAIGASFSDSAIHVVVDKDFPYNTVDDVIKNKMSIRIATEKYGSSDEFTFRKFLEYFGYTEDDVKKWGGEVFHTGYAEMTNMFKDRHVDMAFFNMGPPGSNVLEMAVSRHIKILQFSKEVVQYFADKYKYESGEKALLKKEMYPNILEEDVLNPGQAVEITCNAELPDEVVYKITKIICENTDRLAQIAVKMEVFKPSEGWKLVAVPLHPGAEKYYKEMGYMK